MRRSHRVLTVVFVGAALLGAAPIEAGALPVVTEIAVHDTSAPEGSGGGLTPIEVPVTLNAPDPLNPVTAQWRTIATSTLAPAGEDFVADQGTVVFAPGQTEATITVHVVADERHEFNDVFRISLSNPVNGVLTNSGKDATVMIMNDDAAPRWSVHDLAVPEGDEGTAPALVTVRLDRDSDMNQSAQLATVAGTAHEGVDYTARSGWVTIPPKTTSATFAVPVIGDTEVEGDETFVLRVVWPTQAVDRPEATITIVDDDVASDPRPGKGRNKPKPR